MPETVTAPAIVASLVAQFEFSQWALLRNLEGITDEEALSQPKPGGNSINWIAGHVITPRQGFLKAFGKPGFLSATSQPAYNRGSKPGDAMPETLTAIREMLAQSHDALVAAISDFDEATLASKAPFSPGGNPNETVGSLLGKLVIHESYHAGQIGMARRLLGKEGAIQ